MVGKLEWKIYLEKPVLNLNWHKPVREVSSGQILELYLFLSTSCCRDKWTGKRLKHPVGFIPFSHLQLAWLQIISMFLVAGEGAARNGLSSPLSTSFFFLRSTYPEHGGKSISSLWENSTICKCLALLEGDIDAGASLRYWRWVVLVQQQSVRKAVVI